MSNDTQNEQTINPEDVQPEAAEQAPEEGTTVDEALASLEQQKIAELEAELAKAKAQIAEQHDSVLRAKADSENARRRAQGEIDKARKFALERFASDLLPVIDNLERAMQSMDTDDEAMKPVLEGIGLTHKSFLDTVEKNGLVAIDPQGEAFNPELHQAMSMQESADVAPNTVIMVMQKGYQLNGRLVRPAMVAVSKAAEGGVNVEA